jgi:O-antigen/teichoic acid export membrane protein
MAEPELTPKPDSLRPSAPPRRSFSNAIVLMVAQVAGMPLSLLNNVVMARYLGADEFGLIYLVGTIWSFGILVVEWGQAATVTAAVAREPGRAGEFLGTGLTWRIGTIPIVYALLAGGCVVLHQSAQCQMALAITALVFTVYTVSGAAQDTLRGFERMDVPAKATIGQQILNLLLIAPAAILSGKLRDVLLAQVAAMSLVAIWVWRSLRHVATFRLSFRRDTLKHLLVEGFPFLVLNLSLALQPNVDALLLAKLAPPESLGWYAAAKRLVGVLVFPANALSTAFYPAWVRLWNEDKKAFRSAASTGFRASTVLVAPIALGCALYPDIGVRAFSRHAFGPAEADVRVLSVFVLALFYSMILGSGIAAAGRSRAWAVCQFSCVVVSAVLDPLLVPYCQRRFGNGSLGVCVSTDVSELLMVAGGVLLLPGQVFDRRFARTAGVTVASGLAMFAAARVLSHLSSFIAAPIAVVAYGVALWAMGGVDPALAKLIGDSVGRRFKRAAA